jgi:hypothetical protein
MNVRILIAIVGIARRRLAQASSPAITAHYHAERNHQGKNNLLLFPAEEDKRTRVERLGGLLSYYHRRAA